MGLTLTDPIPWAERASLPKEPGIYVIAKGDPGNTVYVGRTWNTKGLRGRIRQFHRSAMTGKKSHAGGVTFHSTFGPDTSDLWIRVHLAEGIDTEPEILRAYIAYAERRFIWEYVEANRRLPACNSE